MSIKKKIVSKGYTIEVVSWENDADNYATNYKTVATIEEVDAFIEMMELCRDSCNSRDTRLGNTYDGDGFDETQKEVVLEFMEKNFTVLFPKNDISKLDEESLIDLFVDKAQDLLSGGEFYCRVCESYTVTYYPEDIYVDIVKAG
jgi:hypothetical protein